VSRHFQGTLAELAQAVELHKAGRLAEAEKLYARCLAAEPHNAAALNNAAAAALQSGDARLAIERFEKLVAVHPENAQGHSNLGYALLQADRADEALRALTRAVELDPRYALAYNNLGIAHERMLRRDEAIRAFERALELEPGYADAAANLGEIWNREGDTARARPVLERALAAQPSHTGARAALAATDALGGRLDDARAALERIVASAPREPLFWSVLGALRTWAGDAAAGESAYRTALRLAPQDPRAALGVAGSLLARGDFADGWRAFEQRPDGCYGAPTRFADIAQWNGQPIAGRLLLTCEQGLGDTVQFARFVVLARERVQRLSFLVDGPRRSLAPLLATLSGVDDLATDEAALAGLPDRPLARASVLSLPYLLGLRVEALPGPIPYLSAPEPAVAAWQPRLEAIPGLRIGLAWAAYARRDMGYVTRQKSVPPDALGAALASSHASFVSLQVGPAAKLELRGGLARIVDLASGIRDFGDTAAIIAGLDLVISSDTSVAHVAGALGKPVWMLDRYNTCWRWRLASDRSPWYPTMRIFRQARFGDWSDPLARVKAALAAFERDATAGFVAT